MEVIAGMAGLIVKVPGALVPPPEVVTLKLAVVSAAVKAIVKVAVIFVLLTTVTLDTLMSGSLTLTVAPVLKFVPVMVTGTAVPCTPEDGLMEVIAGVGAPMVNV